jgi:hypothetical protein
VASGPGVLPVEKTLSVRRREVVFNADGDCIRFISCHPSTVGGIR